MRLNPNQQPHYQITWLDSVSYIAKGNTKSKLEEVRDYEPLWISTDLEEFDEPILRDIV